MDRVVFDIGNVLIRWDPRNFDRRMGYADATTSLIMAETGLPELDHRTLDAGAPSKLRNSLRASRSVPHSSAHQRRPIP
jgi:hypothetical protein